MNTIKMKEVSAVILRVGIALVVMWFGYQQFTNPEMWMKMLPDWTKSFPISQINFIYVNAWFEMIFGTLLFLGLFTRFVAFLVALHLFHIMFTVGYGGVGVRDFGLALGAVSIFFYGSSMWSLDMLFSQKTKLS